MGACGDAHHLNCLVVLDGRLLACAFGRFSGHRAWSVPGAAEGAGCVFDVASGQEILGGLTCPHHPRRLDGRWLVCDSHGHALVEIHDDGRRRRVELGGWTRGIAYDERSVYVGLSAQREGHGSSGQDNMASIVVLDRAKLEETARLALPCREVYDLAFAPASRVAGLEVGFRTNSLRVAEQDQYALFRTAGVEPARLWAIADPLRPEDCAVEVALELMGPLALGGSTRARFRVVNRGGAVLVTAPPHPVSISWRWFAADGAELVEQGPRVPLPRSLPPGALAEGELRIPSPEHEGDYLLRATLVQEHIRWFDDVDAAYGCSQAVGVVHRSEYAHGPAEAATQPIAGSSGVV
jgi:acetolactate synthase I/II/III large subunit